MDSSWQLKFRRILLVFEGEVPQDMMQVLQESANDVTLVDLQNPYGMDYLQLPADCMVVVDNPIRDILGAGSIAATANLRMLPTLILHDDRPSWAPGSTPETSWVPFDHATYLDDIRAFLDTVQPVDYASLNRHTPWVMRPWTASAVEIQRALGLSPTG